MVPAENPGHLLVPVPRKRCSCSQVIVEWWQSLRVEGPPMADVPFSLQGRVRRIESPLLADVPFCVQGESGEGRVRRIKGPLLADVSFCVQGESGEGRVRRNESPPLAEVPLYVHGRVMSWFGVVFFPTGIGGVF